MEPAPRLAITEPDGFALWCAAGDRPAASGSSWRAWTTAARALVGDRGGPPLALAVARLQHGIIATPQMRACGISSGSLARRLGERLLPVHRGVWRLREAPQTRKAALAAAVLAGGPLAVVAGRASARSHGLLLYEPEDIEVATPWQRGPADGIAWRERVNRADPVLVTGVPCSGVPRVLLELGATATRAELLVAIALAEQQGLVTLAEWDALQRTASGHAGALALRRARGQRLPELARVNSMFEAHALLWLRDDNHLVLPLVNEPVVTPFGVRFPDWRWGRFVVELDGPGHGTPEALHDDRVREFELRAIGCVIVRYSRDQFFANPDRIRAELSAGIAAHGHERLLRAA